MFWNRCRENQWEKDLQNQVDSPCCSVFDVLSRNPERPKTKRDCWGLTACVVVLSTLSWSCFGSPFWSRLCMYLQWNTKTHSKGINKLCIRETVFRHFVLYPRQRYFFFQTLSSQSVLMKSGFGWCSACLCEAEESWFLSESTKQVHLHGEVKTG